MYKDYRYINAGTNEFYRWGKKAQERVAAHLIPENGYYTIQADGGKYWTIGTSEGQYGEFAKFKDTFLSVNKLGFVWAKVGTPKADAFIEMIQNMLEEMKNMFKDKEENEEE